MKWYEWLLVVVLIFFSNAITLFVAKEYFFKVKTVDLTRIGLFDLQELQRRISQGEDMQKIEGDIKQRAKLVELYLQKQKGLILIKQCVVSGDVEDITDEVVNYLKRP